MSKFLVVLCMAGALLSAAAVAEDWPMFRHDKARSAVTTEQLAAPLFPQWVFSPMHAPAPAWPEEGKEKDRVRFDEAYHVAVVGDAVYFGSSSDDKVYCLDAATGRGRWSAFTGGPVRVAPTVVADRVYAGSDDGYAYCLNARDGSIIWKAKGPIRDDKVIGNGRMISLWPVRTGVLVDKARPSGRDVAYFGAGVFPHENLFLCAVNASDGTLIWRNDSFGQEGYKLEYGGISPQGPLLASKNALFVPSGRAMPAAFDRRDGRFEYYASPTEHVGGCWALLTDNRLLAGVDGKEEFDQQRGWSMHDTAYAWFPGQDLVVTPDHAYMVTSDELMALDRKAFKSASESRRHVESEIRRIESQIKRLNGKAKKSPEDRDAIRTEKEALAKQTHDLEAERKQIENSVTSWRTPCALNDALLLAGNTLFAGGKGGIRAARTDTGAAVWSAPVEGRACGLAVANGRLFVSTDTGKIYCFAGAKSEVRTIALSSTPAPKDDFASVCAKAADEIVASTQVKKGFCLVLGSGTGRLAYELAKRTELKIVGIEPDPARVAASRKMLDDAGLYGARVVIEQGALDKLPYADYFANLIVSEQLLKSDMKEMNKEELVRVLKPHGGIMLLGRPAEAPFQDELPDLAKVRAWLEPQGAFTVDAVSDKAGKARHWLKVTRGALPGEGKWTHEYAEPGNTACSDDTRVKGALGVLWFGRPGPNPMVDRHSRPAAPVARDGRMFVQGENVIMAYDAYNGTLLWERKLPGALRVRVDSDMGDLALEADGLYVATSDKCIRLDPITGATVREYTLPDHGNQPKRWGYIAANGHILYGSIAEPMRDNYGALWDEVAGENGEWGDIAAAAQKRGLNGAALTAELKDSHPKPDARAYWDAQHAGMMWRSMTNWPAWGSVATPEGAITDRIMASDSVFALDTETGKLLWRYDGKAVAHPAIAIGDGTLFLADCSVTEAQRQEAMQKRQELIQKGTWGKDDIKYEPKDADIRRVLALDAATGKKRWERVMDLTGCGGDRMGLAYKDGVLCFFGCFSDHDRQLFRDGKLAWRRITAVAGKDGADLWSQALNYLRRPVIMGDTILIEPRGCDLHTGAIKTRLHPLTGEESTWEYVRPGHCCSTTSAAPNMFFLRGGFLWYYDMQKDEGMLPFGGIRPGCWINVIPANGLVLFPEASAGCTCSFPIRSTVVLEPKKDEPTWATCVQHGNMTPVKHIAVNFGAPGDRRADDGTLWFAYPHPPKTEWYQPGVDFKLDEKFLTTPAWFARNPEGPGIAATDKPWLFANGAKGITSFEVPLLDEGQGKAAYTVRLYFAEPDKSKPGQRVFSVKLQDKVVLDKLDPAATPNTEITKEFKGIAVERGLRVELVPETSTAAPVISGIEAIREDAKVAQK